MSESIITENDFQIFENNFRSIERLFRTDFYKPASENSLTFDKNRKISAKREGHEKAGKGQNYPAKAEPGMGQVLCFQNKKGSPDGQIKPERTEQQN